MKKRIIITAMALGLAAPSLGFAASNDNEAYVYQDYFSDNNLAEISQEFGSNHNYANIYQLGGFNQAYVVQEFVSNANGDISQDGADNYAEIRQLDGSNSAVAMIQQSFDLNNAYIEQSGSSGSLAEVYQFGLGNTAEVYQGAANPGGAGNNTAYVEMYGDDDYVVIDQSGSTGGWASAYSEGGGFNEIWISQAGFNNTASGYVWDYGSMGNIIDIQQAGRANDAVAEVGTWGVSSDSFVTIYQEGFSNIAYSSADGGVGNDLWIDQVGNNNDAFAVADGNDNIVTISQYDNRNIAQSESYGDANVVNIYQGGL